MNFSGLLTSVTLTYCVAVLADMNDVRETETEVAGSVAMVTVSDATTDNKRTTASVIVID